MKAIYEQTYKMINEIVNNVIRYDPDKDDLIQDIAVSILEKPPDVIRRLYEEDSLKYYIVRMVKNNVHSKNSPFYYKYKKHHQTEIQFDNLQSIDEHKNTEKS